MNWTKFSPPILNSANFQLHMSKLSPKRLIAVVCLVLAVGTFAVYWPILWHAFLNYDDPDYILDNPHVKSGLTWSGIIWAFQPNAYAANWHPLTWISHMLDCRLFGLQPAGHHFVNVLFHTANTLLLFILLNNLTGAIWRSAFVAALFAWHPLHVESVAWASERKDVLSAFFCMLSLIVYTKYAATNKNRPSPVSVLSFVRSGFYWLALLFFACGLMSKPMVVTLPFVLLLLDFWPLQRFSHSSIPRLIIEKIPLFFLMFASCLMTLFVQKGALWSSATLPFQFRLANALMSYVRYISKIFCPTKLSLIYPYPHSWPPGGVIATAAILVILSVIFILQARRFPYLIVGWLWFLGTLVPVIGLVQVGVQSIADRYTYLPSIGIFILVVWGVNDLLDSSARKITISAFAGAGILITSLMLTAFQLRYWQNSLTIFAHTVAVTEDNYAADDCLGKTLHNMGQFDKARIFYAEAVQLEPTYPMAQFDLGMNLLATGDSNGASNHLATAVQLWTGNPVIQYDFGVFLLQHGQTNNAITHFNAALAAKPDFTEAKEKLEQIK
jgi:protein O-mannosyl-transferase